VTSANNQRGERAKMGSQADEGKGIRLTPLFRIGRLKEGLHRSRSVVISVEGQRYSTGVKERRRNGNGNPERIDVGQDVTIENFGGP